jgi:hypothetical protein
VADTAQLPIWAVYAVGFGTPASAFFGVMLTGLLGRRSAAEIERRSRREEVMRLMRWSAEMAMDSDERKTQLGVQQLRALACSELLGISEKPLVDAALDTALAEAVTVIRPKIGYPSHARVKEGGTDA